MNLKKIGKVFTSKPVGNGPSSFKKGIYRAAVSQRLRNTHLQHLASWLSGPPLKYIRGLLKPSSQYFVPVLVQNSNSLVSWGLNTAESTVQAAFETTLPAVVALERPIAIVDSLLCKSLDIVEERIPVVTLPPALVSTETKLFFVSVTNLMLAVLNSEVERHLSLTRPNLCR